MKKQKPIVTREFLINAFNNTDKNFAMHAMGRALVHLYNRQTHDEKASDTTRNSNSLGFNHADAKLGSRAARYYLKYRGLENWMIEIWLQKNRLAKYHRQLNEVAEAKQRMKGE